MKMKKRRLKKKIRSAERKKRYCTQAQHLGKLISHMQLVPVWAGEKKGSREGRGEGGRRERGGEDGMAQVGGAGRAAGGGEKSGEKTSGKEG